jgi:hypothetical protein
MSVPVEKDDDWHVGLFAAAIRMMSMLEIKTNLAALFLSMNLCLPKT